MKSFLQSVYFKIGSIILIIEILVLTAIGTVYLTRFFNQIDEQVLERSLLLGKLVNANLVRILSINDPESMQLLIGEEVIDVFLTTPDQSIFYSQNRDLVGSDVTDVPFANPDWFDVSNPEEVIEQIRDEDESYVITVSPISLTPNSDSVDFFLYTRTNTTEAEAEKGALVGLFIVATITTILLTSIAIIVVFNITLLQRINNLAAIMGKAEGGNLTVQVEGKIPNDELGILERGTNSMISQLNDLFETLEQRVADRTRDLRVAADVSRQITTVLDIDELLQQIVIETNKAFGLNFSSIFLLRDGKLIRASNADGTGKPVENVVEVYELSARPSIVAEAGRELKAINVADVVSDSKGVYRQTLQETRSELAIPMLLGSKLIGVFDVQSTEIDHFQSDEIQVLTTLAEQIAVAVRNAELFAEAQSATAEAEKANKVKSQFLAAMSHELRTPLNAILNFTQFVSSGMVGPVNDNQVDILGNVVNSGKHLLSLINDVLDISKIESGSLKLFVEENIELEKEAIAVVEIGKTLLSKKSDVSLVTDYQENLPAIVGDKRRIRQIMLNLVSNACKFTEEGEIKVSMKKQDDQVIFTVEDTGPGIAPEDYDLVFETFKQTDTGLQEGQGTGLGLPISRKLAEAHGGNLWFESTLGEGAKFFVSFPIRSSILIPQIREKK